MVKRRFRNYLLRIAREGSSCGIQHKGSPCNTCFHTWADTDLDLHPRLGHALWLINLSLRGDYEEADLKEAIKEL